MLNKNETVSNPEKLIVIIAVIASCLTSKAVYAQEQEHKLPIKQSPKFNDLPLAEPLSWRTMDERVSEKPLFKINDEGFSTNLPTVKLPFQPTSWASSMTSLPSSLSVNFSAIPINHSTFERDSFISIVADRARKSIKNINNDKFSLNSVPNLAPSFQGFGSDNCNVGARVSEVDRGKSCSTQTAGAAVIYPGLENLFSSPNSVGVVRNAVDFPTQGNQALQPNLASLKDSVNTPTSTKIAQSDSGIAPNSPPSTAPPTPQEIDKQITNLQQRLKTLDENTPDFIWFSSPGRSANVPTAWGASFGDVGVGFGFQNRTRFTNTSDGGAGIGFGLGDPYKAVGFDVGININDLGLRGNESFAGRGSFNFTVHRVLPDDFRVAVGLENALVWGGTDTDTSLYGVVSKTVRLKESRSKPFSRLYLNAGIGNGRFRSARDALNNGGVGAFGSAAVRVIDQMNVFTEWIGQDLNAGLSIAPFSDIPIVITPTAVDITGSAGNGIRFVLVVGYGFRL